MFIISQKYIVILNNLNQIITRFYLKVIISLLIILINLIFTTFKTLIISYLHYHQFSTL